MMIVHEGQNISRAEGKPYKIEPIILESLMHRIRELLLFVGVFVAAVQLPAAAENKWPLALKELVSAERAFAGAAEARGVRAAFLEYLAPTAIVFRPGPVLGRPVYEQIPAEAISILAWRPTFAEVAPAGDLGYTTGPWSFKVRRQDPDPVGYGQYVSVWRKCEDGIWQVWLDAGIRHGKMESWPETVQFPDNVNTIRKAYTGAGDDNSARSEKFIRMDNLLSQRAAAQSPAAAYLQMAARDLRLLRDRMLPVCGLDRAAALLPASKSNWIWHPAEQGCSKDGRLGYTYGILETRSGPDPGSGFRYGYLHIWRCAGSATQLVLDLAVPIGVTAAP
jgi:ketosteroid isomerase-like protein